MKGQVGNQRFRAVIKNSFKGPLPRARKDARKARTSFPGQLLTKGAPGRRNGRQRAVDQTQGCWTADGRPYPVAWFESKQRKSPLNAQIALGNPGTVRATLERWRKEDPTL